jgi:hypothetical protein
MSHFPRANCYSGNTESEIATSGVIPRLGVSQCCIWRPSSPRAIASVQQLSGAAAPGNVKIDATLPWKLSHR